MKPKHLEVNVEIASKRLYGNIEALEREALSRQGKILLEGFDRTYNPQKYTLWGRFRTFIGFPPKSNYPKILDV